MLNAKREGGESYVVINYLITHRRHPQLTTNGADITKQNIKMR